MPVKRDDVVDQDKLNKDCLAEARRQFKLLVGGLETTPRLASDLISIRQIRCVMDDCKRRIHV